tara:strand:- start:21 stop:440 length:420 start_codon:yes stop_codon:yes gene_type:complete
MSIRIIFSDYVCAAFARAAKAAGENILSSVQPKSDITSQTSKSCSPKKYKEVVEAELKLMNAKRNRVVAPGNELSLEMNAPEAKRVRLRSSVESYSSEVMSKTCLPESAKVGGNVRHYLMDNGTSKETIEALAGAGDEA